MTYVLIKKYKTMKNLIKTLTIISFLIFNISCAQTIMRKVADAKKIENNKNFSQIYKYLQKMPSKHFENEEVVWHEWAFNNKIYHSIEYF